MTGIIFFHEPEFFPSLEFFYGLFHSDMWCVIDHLPYKVRSAQNRCRIRTHTGVLLVSVSVKRPCNRLLCRMMINNMQPWKKRFFSQIERCYMGANYYANYIQGLEYCVNSPNTLLETLTVQTVLWIAKMLGHIPRLEYTSRIFPNHTKKSVIEAMCTMLDASPFQEEFIHPYYKQRFQPFEENLSALDALFNIGAEATRKLLLG